MPAQPYRDRDYIGVVHDADPNHTLMCLALRRPVSVDKCRFIYNGNCRVMAHLIMLLGAQDRTVRFLAGSSRFWGCCENFVVNFHLLLFQQNQAYYEARRQAMIEAMSSDSE